MRKNKVVKEQKNVSILTLDDDRMMTLTIQSYFQASGYEVDIENDPEKAVERMRAKHYDILLLDFLMSPICGDQVVAQLREFDKEVYVILLTGHKSMAPPIKTIRELDIQGYYEKSDRFDQLELLVESCVKSLRLNAVIRQKNEELKRAYSMLRDSYIQIISALRTVVDARDIYTRGHSDRVSHFATLIAEAMEKDKAFVDRVRLAGLFHDVGKVGTPDDILLKNGPLSDDEYAEIKAHPRGGKKILSAITAFDDILPIVVSHHERIDGKGYPAGLAGEDIVEEARIIAVADAFDAMTGYRRYRRNLSLDEAVEQLIGGKGTQFDQDIVDVFLRVLEGYDRIKGDLEWTYSSNEPMKEEEEGR